MKYKVILFDADDTLFDFKRAERYAFLKTLEDLNIVENREKLMKIYSNINKEIWEEFDKGKITQENLKVDRFKRFLKKVNLSKSPLEFSDRYLHNLAKASFLYDESENLIKNLSYKYRLMIITNGLTIVQNNRIRNSKIAKYFEKIIISEEVGVAKPNAKIFEYALKEINHKNKKTVLMVGDSLTSDIKGGINFGIDTCWINWNKISNKKDYIPTYEVSNLLSLNNLL